MMLDLLSFFFFFGKMLFIWTGKPQIWLQQALLKLSIQMILQLFNLLFHVYFTHGLSLSPAFQTNNCSLPLSCFRYFKYLSKLTLPLFLLVASMQGLLLLLRLFQANLVGWNKIKDEMWSPCDRCLVILIKTNKFTRKKNLEDSLSTQLAGIL